MKPPCLAKATGLAGIMLLMSALGNQPPEDFALLSYLGFIIPFKSILL